MSSQTADNTTNTIDTSASLQPNRGPISQFTRTLSMNARSYFCSRSEGGSTASYSHQSPPGTPAVGDVIGNPTPFQRFLSLGRTGKHREVQFPPPHWGNDKEEKNRASTGQADPSIVMPEHSASPAELADPAVTDPGLAESIDSPPEPNILARRIQALLAKSSVSSTKEGSAGESESTSAEVTHPPPQLVSDPKLITLLSSPAVMNGSLSKAGQSVWTVLDRLRAHLPGQAPSSTGEFKPKQGSDAQEEVLDDDDSGVMVYGPLLPDGNSTVELAESELEYMDDAETGDNKPSSNDRPTGGKGEPLKALKDKVDTVWPFKGHSDGSANGDPSNARVYFTPTTKSKRVWIPSPDKISIQVMWWGYRIYLPPPVLDILDNKQLEGAKRAALLTTALKYALDRVPMAIIPPPARPPMMLLKACSPYLGYVGGFVAWSWGAVKAFDKGNGVTLTATWLLTVAVIPGTWEERGLPKNACKPVSEDTTKNNDAKQDISAPESQKT